MPVALRLQPVLPPFDPPNNDDGFDAAEPWRKEFPFQVERWDCAESLLEGVVAIAATFAIGRATFLAAIEERPDGLVILRFGRRTLLRSDGKPLDA